MALQRKRRRGPTQEKVLAALWKCSGGATRAALVADTGLTREQVISALRGLLNREAVYKYRAPGQHSTAPYTWRAVHDRLVGTNEDIAVVMLAEIPDYVGADSKASMARNAKVRWDHMRSEGRTPDPRGLCGLPWVWTTTVTGPEQLNDPEYKAAQAVRTHVWRVE